MPRLWVVLLALGLLGVPAMADTLQVPFMPALYWQDYGTGTAHIINNYFIASNTGTNNGTWQILATNDQHTFSLIDSRKDMTLAPTTQRQFNLSNVDAYRFYYLYAVSGFDPGSTIDITFEYTGSVIVPKEDFTPYFNFTQKRSPYVIIFDFSKDQSSATLVNYTITTQSTFPAAQTWYLYGTNATSILGNENPAVFTLLDTRTTIGFTGGLTQTFDITNKPPFTHYIIYQRTGFDQYGELLEYRLNMAPRPYVPGGGQYQGFSQTGEFVDAPMSPLIVVLALAGLLVIIRRRLPGPGMAKSPAGASPLHF